ncbi:MAG: hypothetical protein JWN25_2525 [Verrucomicrobiales bacterium]|nr:hypothetical protein [Verrucomicrobiales bacterium]
MVVPLLFLVLSLLCGLFGLARGWFIGEPIVQGRSVTGWLDRISYTNVAFPHKYANLADVVAHDPALNALMSRGKDVVPILVHMLTNAPVESVRSSSFMDRTREWLRKNNLPMFPKGPDIKLRQRARKDAAALAMIAIGPKAGGGVATLFEISAFIPADGYGHRGPDFSYASPVSFSRFAFPARKEEILEGLRLSMLSTNALTRMIAADSTYRFSSASIAVWKKELLAMTMDSDQGARTAAVTALAMGNRIQPDTEITTRIEFVVMDESRPSYERARAAGYLGTNAVHLLPVLRALAKSSTEATFELTKQSIARIEKANPGLAK